jgi:YkoY family integral membrane protein
MDTFISPEVLHDAATIGFLVVLEGLLSGDNALVLAVLVKHLPAGQRKRALSYGILGAFVFRAVGVALAAYLISLWYLKALGALYLCFLCGQHLYVRWRRRRWGAAVAPAAQGYGFWRTVVAVELTDIAFSIDSIMAAVGVSPKKYIVYIGGVLGIITMRFVAGYFLRLLEKFPGLETSAYLMVGWIGAKLGVEIYAYLAHPEAVEAARRAGAHFEAGMSPWLFWSVLSLLFCAGFMMKAKAVRHKQGA